MKWLTALLGAALLAGCATEASVLLPDNLRAAIQQQAVAVLFTDDVGEIRYVSGRFNTMGVNRPDYAARYGDVWGQRRTSNRSIDRRRSQGD